MSVKGKEVDVINVEVPIEDPSLRISMANLSLRDDFQSGDHVGRRYPGPVIGQTNKLTGDHFQDENSKALLVDDIGKP